MLRRLLLLWRSLVERSMPGRPSPSVARRVTGTANVDDEDDSRRPSDLTSVTHCKQADPLPFRHSCRPTQVHRAWILFSQALATNEALSAVTLNMIIPRSLIDHAALMSDWSRSSRCADNPTRTALQWSSRVRTRLFRDTCCPGELLPADWTTDVVKLTQCSKAAGDDLGDVCRHWQTAVDPNSGVTHDWRRVNRIEHAS